MMRRLLTTLLASALLMIGTAAPAHAGSTCRDGSWTPSEGSGTCSHHGGVAQSGVPAPGGSASGGSTSPSPAAGGSAGGGSSTSATPYKRSYFKHWVTQPDGCTTRQAVLIREAIGGVRKGCQMIGAKWFSRYDGVTTTNPSTFDIDHVVPLKDAWVSGAWAWNAAKRMAFANDLTNADTLIAVSASSNRSKGDKDPAQWLPPDASQQCWYVMRWKAVKTKWKLTMDPAERAAVNRILATC